MIIRPNPNNGNFTIELTYVTNKTKMEIYNQLGTVVFMSKINTLETEINTGLTKGIYILKILENTSLTSIQKLIIQ